MSQAKIKMGEKIFMINSKYPKFQNNYFEYYTGKDDRFEIISKLNKVVLLKKKNDEMFCYIIFIAKDGQVENI